MSFASLGLSAELLRTLDEQGYSSPTPVQAQAIPSVLAGSDLMASAQTGTGKTAAFALPMLQRLSQAVPSRNRRIRALVLTPTRELAAQVSASMRTYGKHLPLRCLEVYGGVGINPQIDRLRGRIDILVATPGRLLDHLTRRTVDLSQVEMLVLDEADRMLDMGFLPAIERILRTLPTTRQTLLFSATFPPLIAKLSQRFLDTPEVIEVARRNATAERVEQAAYLVDSTRKRELLSHLIGSQNWHQVLVFTRTKHGADRLARQLERDGIQTAAIHGNKSQNARTRALDAFRRRSVQALVATDVAARGLDIDRLPHVVNFELPQNAEDYVHRIGRTGRAGEAGTAISLVCADERGQFAAIQRLLKADIPAQVMVGFEPTQTSVAPARRQPSPRHRPSSVNAAPRSKRPARPQARNSSNHWANSR